ncbi:Z1 domain-containing protein [Paenibacillus sp. AN1007]|uniref:Z1 domain-containing protein n=1 Tax=Paenibacillus sp. AN1007 TaxID=3151385 RepID=A0AAU8N6D8_9BACL
MREIIQDGERVSNFLSELSAEIGEAAASNVLQTSVNILERIPEVNSSEKILGLLYGLIQSGKTNIINMTVALAADNGYKLFVVLTDRNNSLQDQTFDRSDSALSGMLVRKMDEISEEDPEYLKTVLETDGIVLICKKDTADLEKLITFLSNQDLTDISALIADDEADAIGLNTNQRIEGEDPSAINQQLLDLRDMVSTQLYLQVTATPQAIILQNKEDTGFYPEFIEIVDAGRGYTGIHTFFQENAKEHIRNVEKEEIKELARMESDDEDITSIPDGLMSALSNFVIGASVRLLENTEPRREQKFTFLCHISPYQLIHTRIKKLTKKFVADLYKALKRPEESEKRDFIMHYLLAAYADLEDTHPKIPVFPDVLKVLSDNINSHDVIVLNAAPESQSNIKLNKKYNFIIGGNKLGRGLTIPRLLVTYYGRVVARPQVDTLMQHARMCGYRSKDLTVTRVFIPEDIADLFEEICEHDAVQRDIIKNHNIESTLYLNRDNLSPSRPNVIPNSVGAYKPGQLRFPKVPEFHSGVIEEVTSYVNEKVLDITEPFEPVEIEVDTVIDIFNKIPLLVTGGWRTKVIVEYLSWYKANRSNSINMLYNIDTNIGLSKSRGSKEIGSVLSPSMQRIVSEVDSKKPLAIFVRNRGVKEGWDGVDFWIPLFRFPEDENNILFNLNNI